MDGVVYGVVYWHWLTLGIILIALEAFVPGAILLWFGLGALAVGVAVLVLPDFPLIAQLLTFVAISFAGLLIGRSYVRRGGQDEVDKDVSRRASYLIGQQVKVIEPIIGGVGKVRVGDSPWRATSAQDLAADELVTVEAVEGASVRVVRAA